uniref:(northern house mosquito) hypothetical protein n=1 Tax=Culex pipiens TaxID=7175 RepID=A0A8D8H958_CULPI
MSWMLLRSGISWLLSNQPAGYSKNGAVGNVRSPGAVGNVTLAALGGLAGIAGTVLLGEVAAAAGGRDIRGTWRSRVDLSRRSSLTSWSWMGVIACRRTAVLFRLGPFSCWSMVTASDTMEAMRPTVRSWVVGAAPCERFRLSKVTST